MSKFFIFWILPVFIGIMCCVMKWATGPFWLGANSDPSYLYLINSLYLVDGITPPFTDHPGTPLQVLGAGVIWVFNIGASHSALLDAVFRHPEFYLHVLYGILVFLFLFSHICLVRYAYYLTNSKVFALALQIPALIWLTTKSWDSPAYILPVVANVNSETLMITVLNVFLMALIKFYINYRKVSLKFGFIFGVIVGLALSIKFTFLPLALIPFVLLPGFYRKIIYLGTMTAAFIFFTLPILENYHYMFDWVNGIITKVSPYATEAPQITGLDVYFKGFKKVIFSHWVITSLVGLGFVVVFYSFFKKREKGKSLIFLATSLGVMVLHIMMVVQHPGPQYMTPLIALIGFVVALLPSVWNQQDQKNYLRILLTIIIILSARSISYAYHLTANNHDLIEFYHSVQVDYADCTIVPYYRGSSPYYALEFGDNCWNLNQYGKELQKLFPDKYFYNVWQKTFQGFDKKIFEQLITPGNGCLLMMGQRGGLSSHAMFQVKEVEFRHQEALYRVTKSVHDEVHYIFLQAQVLYRKGDYQNARLFAEAAHAFGHPRAQDLLKQFH